MNHLKILRLPFSLLALTLLVSCNGSSSSSDSPEEVKTELVQAHCDAVADSLNIHWKFLDKEAPCTGIEFTDGTKKMAADGVVSLLGTDVSNPGCIGMGTYEFTLSEDTLTLKGKDTYFDIKMTLTRQPDEDCFVGHWIDEENGWDYRAHISADWFL